MLDKNLLWIVHLVTNSVYPDLGLIKSEFMYIAKYSYILILVTPKMSIVCTLPRIKQWGIGRDKKKYTISFLNSQFYCFFFFNFYCSSITIVCIFSPSLHSTPAKPTSLPHFYPPPWFCPCVLYSSSWKSLSPLSPPHSPLVSVRLLLTSMPLVIFCLLFSSVD